MKIKAARSVRVVLAAGALALASAAPALAENVQCNWFGGNCRGVWDHGYGDYTVYSNYLQYDLTHSSSVFGTASDGTRRSNISACKSPNQWSYANLNGVTSSREAYYRNC